MHFFLAACQGAGLAVAAGAIGGAPGRRSGFGTVLLIAAVIGGAVLFGASLASEGHPSWPGWPAGALIAAASFLVLSDFAAGAASRADGGAFIAASIALAGLAIAAFSVLLRPLGLVALAAVVYLGLARRRRAARKYEGLRTLR